jgi:hypothetical protein
MKTKWKLVYAAVATALLLSACGTAKTGSENPDGNTSGAAGLEDTEKDNVSDDSTNETEGNRPDSIVLNYKEGTADKSADAILTASDEQNYSIYVLPQYKLSSEEPGKDVLYLDEDGSIFMRIETMSFDEDTFTNAVENIQATLEASSDGVTPEVITESSSLPIGNDISDVKAFKVQTETNTVTGIVFERGGLIVKLTIFDTAQENHSEQFLRMGETIFNK